MRITEDCRGPNRKLYHADRIDEVILFSESYMKGYDSKLKLCNRGYFGVADMVIHLYISVCKEVSLSPKFCDGFVRWLTIQLGLVLCIFPPAPFLVRSWKWNPTTCNNVTDSCLDDFTNQ